MSAPRRRFDVAIVGGGIIGCGLARELARRGRQVVVLERSQPGAEASSAAAGLLAPQAECSSPGPFFDLGLESRSLHEAWARELASETGIDVGYRRCGILRCSFAGPGRLAESFGWQKGAGLSVETLDSEKLRALAGARVSPRTVEGLFFPDEAIVDGALLTKALALSAAHRGVTILTDTPARRFLLGGGSCVGVETERGPIEADRVINAAGAWAGFDGGLSFAIPVEPVRGQIVELSLPGVELTTVVQDDDVYLVPRPRGRVLVGATVERVGFRKEVTAAAVAGLIAAASRLLPDLSDALFLRAWAGLRPGTPDDLPILGASPVAGLFLAVGHYRNGILLAPVTARGMADLLEGSDVPAFAPFSIDRFPPRTAAPSGPSSGSEADGG